MGGGIQILVSNSNIKRTKVNKNTETGKSLSSSEIQILILPDENFHISRRTVLSNQIYINGLIDSRIGIEWVFRSDSTINELIVI